MGRPPKSAKALEDASPKKARLTITQLAAYDDVLTDVLVDHVFAWHHVRKNLDSWRVRNYKYSRGVNGDDVTRILFEDIVLNKNPARALDRILQLSALQTYYNKLQTERERNDFRRHAAKYVNIWLPDCAFEVSFTNRYMVDQWEGKTTARKFIKAGEKIKYLCGELVQISLGEVDDDRFIENAFSITYSSRRKTPSLFLGPARFSNHDCNANAKLESRGNEGMCVIAVRDIELGEEINVHYGDNYFGEDNCECLCASCEKYGQGAWQNAGEEDGTRTPRAGSEEAVDPGSRRSKRKHNIVDYKQRLRDANTRMEEDRPAKRNKAEFEYNGRIEEWTPTPEAKELHSKPYRKINERSPMRAATKPTDARTAAMLALVGRSTLPPKSSSAIKAEYENSPHGNRWALNDKPALNRKGKPKIRGRKRRSTSSVLDRSSMDTDCKSHMLFAFLKRESVENDSSPKPKRSSPCIPNIPSIEVEAEQSQESTVSSEEASIFDIDQVERRSASPITEPPSGEDIAVELEHIDARGVGLRIDQQSFGSRNIALSDSDVYNEDHIATPKKRGRPPASPLSKVVQPPILEINNSIESQPVSTEDQDTTGSIPPTTVEDSTELVQPIAVTELTTTTIVDPTTTASKNPAFAPGGNSTPSSPTSPTTATAHRVPGDYIRTSRLLSARNCRWVDCRTCDDVFIQQEAHQTRRECPRCERHSKLYGFQWPQTDYDLRGGEGNNGQKRVMDHRTVNRFLSRAEEMEVSRRGRGCVVNGGSRAGKGGGRIMGQESPAVET